MNFATTTSNTLYIVCQMYITAMSCLCDKYRNGTQLEGTERKKK